MNLAALAAELGLKPGAIDNWWLVIMDSPQHYEKPGAGAYSASTAITISRSPQLPTINYQLSILSALL
jgi:hypothetical protein